jgi:DNA polymerase-3 subunit beta
MDITMDSRTLSTALALTARVASKKSTMPLLSCARMFAANGIAYLTSTDLHTSLALPCAASVTAPGDVAFDVANVVESLKSHKASTPVRLVCGDGTMSIAVGGASYKLRTVPAEDMPALPAFKDAAHFATVDGATLAKLIARVAPCVSTDDTRPHLASMLMEVVTLDESTTVLRAVATDGHRLALDECATTSATVGSVLVPRHALDTLARALKGYKGQVAIDTCKATRIERTTNDKREVTTVEKSERMVRFTLDDGRAILARVTDSQFPPYQQVIPQRSEHRATFDRKALKQAVKVASASAGDRGVLHLHWSDRLTITASDPAKGSASIEVESVTMAKGKIDETGINGRYLTEALDAFTSSHVHLDMSGDSLDPILVRGADACESSALVVAMPCRI